MSPITPDSDWTAAFSRAELIRNEQQIRFERFLYIGSISFWLTGVVQAASTLGLAPALSTKAMIWAAALTGVMLLTVCTWHIRGRNERSMDVRDRWHVIVVAAHGWVWALSPWILFLPTEPRLSMLMMCLAMGLSAGAVPIFGTRHYLYVLMFAPIYGSQITVFLWQGWLEHDAFHGYAAFVQRQLAVFTLDASDAAGRNWPGL